MEVVMEMSASSPSSSYGQKVRDVVRAALDSV